MTAIAVMNAKGGVGKSTLTMAIAETLAAYHGKSILLIDADGQMSLSLMVMPVDKLNHMRDRGQSITGWLSSAVLSNTPVAWTSCVAEQVGDVDDAKNIFIMPGDMDLTLVEREIAARGAISGLRAACRQLLLEAKQQVDIVLVDCAPGISVMTECWLRECDWHLIPVKPDMLATSGIQYLKRFRDRDPALGFAKHLGVVINMKQMRSEIDQLTHDLLMERHELDCFKAAIPLIPHIQKAALFMKGGRSYQNKYPGVAGHAFHQLANELLQRLLASRAGRNP